MMKALSIRQPWAWLIVNGYKDVENRSWSTRFRGRIYIHAGKRFDWAGYRWLLHQGRRLGHDNIDDMVMFFWGRTEDDADFGSIIGEVDIVYCKSRFEGKLLSEWYEPGQYGFVLHNPTAYARPIPCKGKLRFFEVDLTIREI